MKEPGHANDAHLPLSFTASSTLLWSCLLEWTGAAGMQNAGLGGKEAEPGFYQATGLLARRKTIRHGMKRGVGKQGQAGFRTRAEDKARGKPLLDLISPWTDTQRSVQRVLEHLSSGRAVCDVPLEDSINKKILMFHDDITEECGGEERQHSWATIEKPDEVCMYGPYYPNYSNGDHSEDTVIKQTQELLQSVDVSEDWLVFIFTLNSPCLANNLEPCMLNLVWRAFLWYTQYGVRTYIGYKKCWGFKGTKENLFREISYTQFEHICVSKDYQSYSKTIQESKESNQSPICENLYAAVRIMLGPKALNRKFPLRIPTQEPDRKIYFKTMYNISDSDLQDEKNLLATEISTFLEALHSSLSEVTDGLEELLQRGMTFARDYGFNPEICDAMRSMLRASFKQCWTYLVQDKYAEFLRERLTDSFSRCTVQLFVNDVTAVTKDYLRIGRIKFAGEEDCSS